jgi:hypothetical protein
MKLTNSIRNAFIRSVMNDVPKIDHSEAIRKLVVEDFASKLPTKIKAIWNDKELRHWIKTDYSFWGGVSVTYPSAEQTSWRDVPALSQKAQIEVDALVKARKEQDEVRNQLESKLKSAAYGCNTRKQLAELLPEFEKYLPVDQSAALTKNLPAVANLIVDFTKAGWPKNQPQVATPPKKTYGNSVKTLPAIP